MLALLALAVLSPSPHDVGGAVQVSGRRVRRETLTHLKKALGPTARASLIWGSFVSKLPYMAGVQVPKRANEIMATAHRTPPASPVAPTAYP